MALVAVSEVQIEAQPRCNKTSPRLAHAADFEVIHMIRPEQRNRIES